MARMIESEICVTGPINVTPGLRRIVALVGPTGVGKTTTIAKLAANFRLREKRRVGLITVDTYRIAAVEQLRTYADIIDLPMEVVSTPKEMRAAVARLSNLDLILIDTAGRSPRDEVRIQELKSLLAEASADEVHLVLSSIGSATNLAKTAERFAEVGTTALLLTKLDESAGLGNLLPLLRASKLPLSYVTNGQNVPDDIQAADQRRLARMVLGMEVGIE
jgi:flagellar biosynthesis protein FlhF